MRVRVCTGTSHCARWAIIIAASGLLGCSTTPTSYDQVGQKQAQGSQIGSVVGGAIGAALDEEDRQALARATRAAFVSGQNKTFSNSRTGVRGSANGRTPCSAS